MYLSEQISEKWQPVMEHKALPEIKDNYIRDVTLRLLDNQDKFLKEAAPTNAMGSSSSTAGAGPIDTWDPILISLVRRAMPQMISYDVCGVQPMTGPTGLIFAMKAQYVRNNARGDEALFNEAETDFSGSAGGTSNANSTQTGLSDAHNPFGAESGVTNAVYGDGMATSAAETLGDGAANHFAEMAFTIDKISVTAKSRALKAEYSTELAQDLKAVHGLDAETELANILSTEILQEINREVIRTIYSVAKYGAQNDVTNGGIFDLDTDSNGRWSDEKFKGLMFQIERDRNEIGHDTRRGKGNFMICSPDVASAMSMGGMLESGHALTVDDTMSTYAGMMNGMKVFIDPYYTAGVGQFYTLGYKGSSAYDAGLFYCPYVPLQMVRAMGENTFQPKIGFKTRYGMVANPFVNATGALTADGNQYYRKVRVANLM